LSGSVSIASKDKVLKNLGDGHWRVCCLDILHLLGIDETSGKILDLLTRNSRISNVEIAEELEISEATVRRRINEMIKGGIIKGFITLVECEEAKNCVKTFIRLKVNEGGMEGVARRISRNKNVVSMYRINNSEFNLLCEGIFRSIIELQKFIDKELKTEGISNFSVDSVVGSYKECLWTGI